MNVLYKILYGLISWLSKTSEPKEGVLCDFSRIRQEAIPCDVLLIEGRNKAHNAIKAISSSDWSQAVLYIGRLLDIEDPGLRTIINNYYDCEPDTHLIIETRIGQGVIVSPLITLEQEHIRICRPKGLAQNDIQQVIRYAISRIGTQSDKLNLFDLTRFFIPWFLFPKSWRMPLFKYNAGQHTKTASADLIAESFDFVQFPILPLVKKSGSNGIQLFRRIPKLCLPIDFDQSPYFDIIKYPFIDFTNHSSKSLLPWKGNGVLSGESTDLYLAHQQANLSFSSKEPNISNE